MSTTLPRRTRKSTCRVLSSRRGSRKAHAGQRRFENGPECGVTTPDRGRSRPGRRDGLLESSRTMSRRGGRTRALSRLASAPTAGPLEPSASVLRPRPHHPCGRGPARLGVLRATIRAQAGPAGRDGRLVAVDGDRFVPAAPRSTATTQSEPSVTGPSSLTSSRGLTTIVRRTIAGPATTVRKGWVTVSRNLPWRKSRPARRTGNFGTTLACKVTTSP
jgi:hypothetical protein